MPGVSPQGSVLAAFGGEGAAPLSFWEAAPAVLWDYSPEAPGSCALWAGRARSTPGGAGGRSTQRSGCCWPGPVLLPWGLFFPLGTKQGITPALRSQGYPSEPRSRAAAGQMKVFSRMRGPEKPARLQTATDPRRNAPLSVLSMPLRQLWAAPAQKLLCAGPSRGHLLPPVLPSHWFSVKDVPGLSTLFLCFCCITYALLDVLKKKVSVSTVDIFYIISCCLKEGRGLQRSTQKWELRTLLSLLSEPFLPLHQREDRGARQQLCSQAEGILQLGGCFVLDS